MPRNILKYNSREEKIKKELEKRNDIKSERIKRLLSLDDLTQKENSPVKILTDKIINLSRFQDFDLVFTPK